MGCFSWDCKACGHSIRAGHATNKVSEWLSQAVLLEADGNTFRGSYDGYGRLESRGGRELDLSEGDGEPCLYHQACYDLIGKPSYNGGSPSARDQGHFVGEYDPAKPHSREDVSKLLAHAKEQARKDAEAARQACFDHVEELKAKGEPVPEWLQSRYEYLKAQAAK